MTDQKKPLPINKRWPGKYAFRVFCYTPKGGCLTIETSADEPEARAILDKLWSRVNASGEPGTASTPPGPGTPGGGR